MNYIVFYLYDLTFILCDMFSKNCLVCVPLGLNVVALLHWLLSKHSLLFGNKSAILYNL